MDPASAFFLTALALQIAFTVGVVLIVRWRFPRRLAAYRWIAPAAVPALLFALVAYSYLASGANDPATLARFALAYAVLWIVGVLVASLAIRVAGRLR